MIQYSLSLIYPVEWNSYKVNQGNLSERDR